MTMILEIQERGAFMSISSSIQQIAGGIASICAGLIVSQTSTGLINHFNILGYIVSAFMVVTIVMIYFIERAVLQKAKTSQSQQLPKIENNNAELIPEEMETK